MKKIRYPYINNPFNFKLPEKKEIIHPVIENWNDFTNEEKNLLLSIKQKIILILKKDYEIYVFGSRVKGYWTEKSDYDILVKTEFNLETLNNLKKINFGVKVDFAFNNNPEVSDKSILIK